MECPNCGAQNADDAESCASCGASLKDSSGLPPKTSGLAISSLVLGAIGLLSCGVLFPLSIAGLILGIVAFRQVNRTGGRLKGRELAVVGMAVSAGALILMVAVGIITAMLFPVFVRAREAARKSFCLSNMSQLGMAIQTYTADYDDTLPSSAVYAYSKKWSPEDFKAFASQRGNLPPSPADKNYTWPMLLYNYMKDKDVIFCPSDPVKNGVVLQDTKVSYYWKAAVDCAWYGGQDGRGRPARRYADFAYPEDQILLWEHNGWHWEEERMGAADGVTINTLFIDGHAASKKIRDSGYKQSENPPSPLPACGVGEPAWFNYNFSANTFSRSANWDPRAWGDNLP